MHRALKFFLVSYRDLDEKRIKHITISTIKKSGKVSKSLKLVQSSPSVYYGNDLSNKQVLSTERKSEALEDVDVKLSQQFRQ